VGRCDEEGEVRRSKRSCSKQCIFDTLHKPVMLMIRIYNFLSFC